MNSRRRVRRGAAALLALLCAVAAPCLSAAALPGFTQDRLWVVTEPEEFSAQYVWYYARDDERLTADDIVWSEQGHTGKAVSLSGGDEYLELNYAQLQMHTMTFAGWFYWRGPAEGQEADAQYRQRLFTLSRNDDIYLTLMPHARDASKTDDEGYTLDGVYLGFRMGAGEESRSLELYKPMRDGVESCGLPQNEWHHIAVTLDGETLRLYIDGSVWMEEMLVLGVDEMRNNLLTIGGGRWGDPSLNALVDDLALYSTALDETQIAMLYQGIDPLAAGAALPSTTAPSLPTQPSTTAGTDAPTYTTAGGLVGVLDNTPDWTLVLISVILVGFVAFTIVLYFYQPPAPPPKRRKRRKKNTEKEGSA